MDTPTLKFLCFGLFSVASLVLGVQARRRGWLHEDASSRIHLITLVGPWAAAALLTLWRLPIDISIAWLLLIVPFMVLVPSLLAIPLGYRLTRDRQQIGVLAVAAGISNTGFTLGAYLCYTLLGDRTDFPLLQAEADKGQANAALAYGVAMVTVMSVAAVAVIFPIARHFAASPGDAPPMRKLIISSFFDIRAAMLWAAVVGIVLSSFGPAYPASLDRIYLLDILFYLGAFTAYVGIGLRLRLGERLRETWTLHAALGGVKFVAIPVFTGLLMFVLHFAPTPPSKLLTYSVMIESCMPLGIQSVIIPNLFGLDARLASSLWLINTAIFAVIVLPVLMFVL